MMCSSRESVPTPVPFAATAPFAVSSAMCCVSSSLGCLPVTSWCGQYGPRPGRPGLCPRCAVALSRCTVFRTCAVGTADLRFNGLQPIRVVDDLLEEGVQGVVAIQLGEQVRQTLARFVKLAQWRHLLQNVDRMKVVHVAELQFDIELAVVITQPVVHTAHQTWRHGRQDIIEV